MKHSVWLVIVSIGLFALAACAPAATPTATPAAPTTAPVAQPTAVPPAEPTKAPEPTAAPVTPVAAGAAITLVDALGREVTFEKAPEHIVIAGKATTLVADALYLFPEAASRITAIELRSQSAKKFLGVVDPVFDQKTMLEANAAAEQIAPLKADAVVLKSSMAEKLGAPLEQLGIKVVYVDLETPETFA